MVLSSYDLSYWLWWGLLPMLFLSGGCRCFVPIACGYCLPLTTFCTSRDFPFWTTSNRLCHCTAFPCLMKILPTDNRTRNATLCFIVVYFFGATTTTDIMCTMPFQRPIASINCAKQCILQLQYLHL
jgi:hypothetical protein